MGAFDDHTGRVQERVSDLRSLDCVCVYPTLRECGCRFHEDLPLIHSGSREIRYNKAFNGFVFIAGCNIFISFTQ